LTLSPLPTAFNSAPHKRPLMVSGLIYASPAEAGTTDDVWTFTGRRGLRLTPTQRRPGTQAYFVIGGSMAPTIPDRSIVLVDPNDAFSTHRPCAFLTPHGIVAKRRDTVRGRPALVSDNKDVEPITQLADIRPLGRIYAVYLGPYSVQWVG
jgi:hypothetical protein